MGVANFTDPCSSQTNLGEDVYLRDVLQLATSGEDCEFAKLPQAPQLQFGLDQQEQE